MFENSHHYQINGGNFTHVSQQINGSRDPLQLLLDGTAPAAFHNSGERYDPPKCHPNTRVAVLEQIVKWVLGEDPTTSNHPIMWVHGPAGSGKSAIEQTMADMLFTEGRLLASYFFSRFDSTRNHARTLIPTIAYQMASHFPEVRKAIQITLDNDPLILRQSLSAQMAALIVGPLQDLIRSGFFDDPKSPRVVVVDGLDECEDRDGQIEILRAISQSFNRQRFPLLFLIASRPEYEITHSFSSKPLDRLTARLPLDDKYSPSHDIRLFLSDKFNDIKQNHPLRSAIPSNWPSHDVLDSLVDKSSGQFIYAATVIRYVQSIRHRPPERLDIIQGLRPTLRDLPFGELDTLYRHVFELVEDKKTVLDILSLYLLTRNCDSIDVVTVRDIEAVLSLQPGDVELHLCDLHSILSIEPYKPEIFGQVKVSLHVFHASLEDFLLDERRSGALHIDAASLHSRFSQTILEGDLTFRNGMKIHPNVLGWHIKHAETNPKLLEAICGLDLTCVYNLDPSMLLAQDIGTFLKYIRGSKFINSEELYDMHFQRLWTYVAEQIRRYYTNPELTGLIAIALLLFVSKKSGAGLIQSGRPITEPRGPNTGLQLTIGEGIYVVSDYAHLLRQICCDLDEPSLYFDSTRYATAALFFAKRLSSTPLKGLATIPARKRLKDSPWKWRKTRIWRYKLLEWDELSEQRWNDHRRIREYRERLSRVWERSIPGTRRSWIQRAMFGQINPHPSFLKYLCGCLRRAHPWQWIQYLLGGLLLMDRSPLIGMPPLCISLIADGWMAKPDLY